MRRYKVRCPPNHLLFRLPFRVLLFPLLYHHADLVHPNLPNIAYNGNQPGDPKKGVQVIVDVIRGEGVAAGKEWPRSLCLGSDCHATVKAESEKTLARLEEWKEASFATDFNQRSS